MSNKDELDKLELQRSVSIASAVNHMLREASETNRVSEPIQHHILKTHS